MPSYVRIVCSNQDISCVPIKAFLVFQSRHLLWHSVPVRTSLVIQSKHLLCSNQNVSCTPFKTFPRCHGTHALVLKGHMWWFPRSTCVGGQLRDVMGWNFGHTILRISASRAKFDARADGDVRLAVRRPKPRKICEKPTFRSENSETKNLR